MPKVLLLNTYYSMGGASIASKRLFEFLQKDPSLEVKLLVLKGSPDKYADKVSVIEEKSYITSKKSFFNFTAERFYFLFYEVSKNVRFAFSPANTGFDISHHPWVQEADILHLHWINFGFLSIQGLQKLFALNKPIVWTMHDMWAFTGGCHYAQTCRNFEAQCGNCLYLRKASSKDLSYQILKKKTKQLAIKSPVHFVGCSQWIVSELQKSSFYKQLSNAQASNIKNPIDHHIYKPILSSQLNQQFSLSTNKFKILFGAMSVKDERKGFKFLQEALSIIAHNHPQIAADLELVIFGKASENLNHLFQIPIKSLGMLNGDEVLVQVYNAVEVFITPSLNDNLPNTIAEAMSCGTPVVAFKTGGIPEMIDHQENGYLANFKSSEDLAKGILWLYTQWNSQKSNPQTPVYQTIRDSAQKKAVKAYDHNQVMLQYIQVYQTLLESKTQA